MAQVLTVRAPPSKRLRGTQATGVADRFYGRTHLSHPQAQGLELFGSQGLQGVVSDLDIELMVMFTIPAWSKSMNGDTNGERKSASKDKMNDNITIATTDPCSAATPPPLRL